MAVYGASVRFSMCIHLLLLSGSVRFVVVRFDLLWFGSICSDSVRFVVNWKICSGTVQVQSSFPLP